MMPSGAYSWSGTEPRWQIRFGFSWACADPISFRAPKTPFLKRAWNIPHLFLKAYDGLGTVLGTDSKPDTVLALIELTDKERQVIDRIAQIKVN